MGAPGVGVGPNVEIGSPYILQVGSYALLYLLITGLAGVVEFKDFTNQFEERRGLYTGILCQFFLLPLVGFLVVTALQLDEVIGITLLVATSSPGGSFSNWWCSVFNVDLALSVALTTVSTACSVVMLPMNMFLYAHLRYGRSVQLNWASLCVSIAVVLSAVSSGLCISARFPEHRSLTFRLGNAAGVVLILLGIFFSTQAGEGGGTSAEGRGYVFYVAVAAPPVIGMLASLCISSACGLPKPQCIAVAIETCYQNTGIALTVALTSFAGEQQLRAAAVPVFYMASQFSLIFIMSLCAWKAGWTYAPANVKLQKFLWSNFQPAFQPRQGRSVASTVSGAELKECAMASDASTAKGASRKAVSIGSAVNAPGGLESDGKAVKGERRTGPDDDFKVV